MSLNLSLKKKVITQQKNHKTVKIVELQQQQQHLLEEYYENGFPFPNYPHVIVNRSVKTFPYDSHSNWYLSQTFTWALKPNKIPKHRLI
jgi:hypothetical protein